MNEAEIYNEGFKKGLDSSYELLDNLINELSGQLQKDEAIDPDVKEFCEACLSPILTYMKTLIEDRKEMADDVLKNVLAKKIKETSISLN